MISKLCLFGDSISKGVIFDAGAQRYKFLKSCFASVFSESTGISVDNHSKFGCTVGKGLELLHRHIAFLRNYDCTVLEYGGNDCDFDWPAISEAPDRTHLCKTPMFEFVRTYEEMIDSVRDAGGKPIMLNMIPLDEEKYFAWISRGLNPANILRWLGNVHNIFLWHSAYNDAVCDIAKRKGVRLIDVRGPFLAVKNYTKMLCEDGIHPNAEGHSFICGVLRDALAAV